MRVVTEQRRRFSEPLNLAALAGVALAVGATSVLFGLCAARVSRDPLAPGWLRAMLWALPLAGVAAVEALSWLNASFYRALERSAARPAVETSGALLLVAGIVLLGNGVAFHALSPTWGRGAAVAMAAGLALVLLALAALHRRVVRSCTSPSFALALIVVAAGLLGALAFALLSYLNVRHFGRVHLADRGSYRLDPDTLNVLRRLDAPLRILSAMVENPSPRSFSQRFNNHVRRRAADMLSEYARQSVRVTHTPINPHARTDELDRLRRELKGEVLRDSVIFLYEGKKKVIEFGELVDVPRTRGEQPTFKGEALFTGALQALIAGRKTRVCFVRGHGEKLIDDYDEGGPGLSAIATALRGDNCLVRAISLPDVPDDCDVLVIPGPDRLMPLPDLEAVRGFLRRENVGLVALLDPVAGDDTRGSGIEDVLGEHGIVVDTTQTIVDLVPVLFGRRPSGTLPLSSYPPGKIGLHKPPKPHPITRDMKRYQTVVDLACPIYLPKPPPGRPPGSDPYVVEFLRTSPQAFVRAGVTRETIATLTPRRHTETRGPFTVGLARGRWHDQPLPTPPPRARIVAFGDSDFVTNAFIARGTTGNAMLFRAAVAWAAGVDYKATIKAKPFEQRRRLDMTAEEKSFARWACVVAPPFHVVLIGIIVWWIRRR